MHQSVILTIKKPDIHRAFSIKQIINYLFITYMVTSKPKRISVAAGFVHIIFLLKRKLIKRFRRTYRASALPVMKRPKSNVSMSTTL